MSFARWTRWSAAVAWMATPALASAQDWTPHRLDREGVSISAPGELKQTDGLLTSAGGAKYPARVYALVQGRQIYTVTVADFSAAPLEGDPVLDLAVQALAKLGTISFDIPARSGVTFGRELNIVRRDGSQSMVSLYFSEKRLYQAEGKSLPPDAEDGSSDSIRFVESIAFPGGLRLPAAAAPAASTPGAAPAPAAPAPAAAGAAGQGGQGAAPAAWIAPNPPPVSRDPVSVAVKAPKAAFTETWRWAPGGEGKVEYCRQDAKARAATCAIADNPTRGDHMPGSQTAPMISAVIPGQAWVAVGGTSYFCKRTSYTKGSRAEVTCEDAGKSDLPREAPRIVQAMANNAARFLFTFPISFYCQNALPAVDGSDSQTMLSCSPL